MKIATYSNPVNAVFLRILAWELYIAQKELRVQDVVTEQVQTARAELGLPLFNTAGGAAHDLFKNCENRDCSRQKIRHPLLRK